MPLMITPDPAEQGRENELRQMVERAHKGDATALPQLRKLLDHNPQLWQMVGDLARHAEEALVGLAAGQSLVLRESLVRRLAELKAELAPRSPLERLLVERIAACWIACNHADVVFGQSPGIKPPREGQLRRRQDRAHRRFLESIKLLATVRRLLADRRPDGSGNRHGQGDCGGRRHRPAAGTASVPGAVGDRGQIAAAVDRADDPGRAGGAVGQGQGAGH